MMVCETDALHPLAMVERSCSVMGCVAVNFQARNPNIAALIPAPVGAFDCCFSLPLSLSNQFDELITAVKRARSREEMKPVKSYEGEVTVEGFRSRSAAQ
jgi:hypothetical protein